MIGRQLHRRVDPRGLHLYREESRDEDEKGGGDQQLDAVARRQLDQRHGDRRGGPCGEPPPTGALLVEQHLGAGLGHSDSCRPAAAGRVISTRPATSGSTASSVMPLTRPNSAASATSTIRVIASAIEALR